MGLIIPKFLLKASFCSFSISKLYISLALRVQLYIKFAAVFTFVYYVNLEFNFYM